MSLAPSPKQDDYFTALRSFLLTILPPGIEIVQAQDNRVPQPAGTDFVIMNEVTRRRLSTNVTTYADCSFAGSIVGATLTVTSIHLGMIALGTRILGAGVLTGTTILSQQSGSEGGTGVYTLSLAQQSPITGVPLATGVALISQPTEITVQVDVYGPGAADNTSTATTLLRDDYATMWFAREGWSARGIGVLDVGEPRQMAFIDGEQQYEDRWSVDVKIQANQVTSPSQDFADSIDLGITTADTLPIGADAALATTPFGAVTVTGGATSSGSSVESDFTGFGYVQYMAMSSSPVLNLSPGVRTPLMMVIDPTQTSNTLKGPFAGFTFWDGTTLSARAAGDLYELRFTLTATSAISGGTLTTDVTINGLTVATDNDSEALSYPAGQPQRVGFKLRLLPKAGFVSGGAKIYLTSTVPVAITSEVLVVDPTNAGP